MSSNQRKVLRAAGGATKPGYAKPAMEAVCLAEAYALCAASGNT